MLWLLCTHVDAQTPSISSFNPARGGQSTAVAINGHFFSNATSVTFGGTPAAFFMVTSDSTIIAFVDNGSSGAISVTTQGGTASLAGFTFVPPPVINTISPASGSFGDTIRISGQHFVDVYDVFFGDSAALSFTVSADTLIKAVVANGSSGQVTISTIGGVATITDFTYTGPVIYSFSPTTGNSGTVVQIKGNKFTGATRVAFGGFNAAAFTVISDSVITATVGAGGPGDVMVQTGRGTAAAPGFIVPVIKSFDPQTGTRYTQVTIKGLNFTGISSVLFGDSSAASFNVISDTVIIATPGGGASGQLTVSNGVYTNSKDYFFYFELQPSISYFTPAAAGTGNTVKIGGAHFTGSSAVTFGAVAAASFTVISDTVINAVVGNGRSGFVTVTNNNIADSLDGFTYLNNQALSLCPPSGSTSITSNLSGTNYQWQLSSNNGASFSNISNSSNYSGVNTATLQLNNIPSSFAGYIYRCVVNGSPGNQSPIHFVNNWTGAVSTLWSNPANWSCAVLPDAYTDVVVQTGSVQLNINGTCRSITLRPTVSFTANAGSRLTVTH